MPSSLPTPILTVPGAVPSSALSRLIPRRLRFSLPTRHSFFPPQKGRDLFLPKRMNIVGCLSHCANLLSFDKTLPRKSLHSSWRTCHVLNTSDPPLAGNSPMPSMLGPSFGRSSPLSRPRESGSVPHSTLDFLERQNKLSVISTLYTPSQSPSAPFLKSQPNPGQLPRPILFSFLCVDIFLSSYFSFFQFSSHVFWRFRVAPFIFSRFSRLVSNGAGLAPPLLGFLGLAQVLYSLMLRFFYYGMNGAISAGILGSPPKLEFNPWSS